MGSSLKSVVLAIAYREFIFFKRFFSEYFLLWVIPLIFSLGIVFLPTTIASRAAVLRRFSTVVGGSFSFTELLTYALCMSAIMSLVIAIVSDVFQTLHQEYRVLGAMVMVLESTSVTTYALATAFVRSLIMGVLSTLYLVAVLPLINGINGLITYATLLPPIIISSIALGLYSVAIAIPLTFYVRLDRPWTVANTLAPALLAGAGLYIPIKLVPIVLRAIAYTAPVPQLCTTVRVVTLLNEPTQLPWLMALVVALATIYSLVTTYLGRFSDSIARRGG